MVNEYTKFTSSLLAHTMHRIILIRCDDNSVAVIIARTIFLFLFAPFVRVSNDAIDLSSKRSHNNAKQKSSSAHTHIYVYMHIYDNCRSLIFVPSYYFCSSSSIFPFRISRSPVYGMKVFRRPSYQF